MDITDSSLLERIYNQGKIASLVRKARKNHICCECKELIEAVKPYYAVTYGGAGLGNLKFPKRAHPGKCVLTCMGFE